MANFMMVFNFEFIYLSFEKHTFESMSVIVRQIKKKISLGTIKMVQISHICMCVQRFYTRRRAEEEISM